LKTPGKKLEVPNWLGTGPFGDPTGHPGNYVRPTLIVAINQPKPIFGGPYCISGKACFIENQELILKALERGSH